MRRGVVLAAALAAATALTGAPGAGRGEAAAGPEARAAAVGLTEVGRFSKPVYVTAPPGDRRRLFVVERGGRIRVLRDGRKLARPFADLRAPVRAGGERGLLSMAFAPDYARSGRLYVFYTDRRGDARVDELRRSSGSADRARASRRTILRQSHRRYPNHYGGQLQFGPDGLLYISLGDGGGAGDPLRRAQNLGSLLGKVLRIDPRRPAGGRPYTVPAGNPFTRRRGARSEIWAYGLRNPFRFSFDRATGDFTLADVGQSAVEEIDFVRRSAGGGRGANFGWNRFEGRRRFSAGRAPGHVPPVLELRHSAGYCAVTGGYVVRDPALPELTGRYVYGDFCREGLRSARLRAGRVTDDRPLGASVPYLASFGEDARGRVYAVSLGGAVLRLDSR